MKYQEFENKISKDLYSDEAFVNVSTLLQDLGIEKKKKKRLLLPFILLSVVSIGSILGYSYFNHNYTTTSGLKIENFTKSEYNSFVTNNTDLNKNIEKKQDKEATFINTPSNTTAPDIEVNKDNKVNEDSKTQPYLIDKSDIKRQSNKLLTQKRMSNNHITDNIQNQDINSAKQILRNVDAVSHAEIKTSEVKYEQVIISPLATKNKNIIYTSVFPKMNKEIECPTFTKNNSLYVELVPEIGIFYPFKKLESSSDEINEIFNQRNNNETSLEGIQAALHVKLRKTNSPYSLRAGLEYQQLIEKMNLKYEYTTRDTSIGVISVTVSQNGDTITTIYGEIIEETLHSGTQIAHHKFRTFDIPIALGYEKSVGSFDVGLEAGISLNISLRNSGSLLNSANTFQPLPDNSLFKSSIGLNYFGGIYAAKNINSLGRFYLALRGRFIPSTFSSPANQIKQSYAYGGLHLGYVLSF